MYDATEINETSTSVSILFKTRPDLGFGDYVARMETALRGNFQDTMRLTWDHEDVAMIDVDGSRVLMGFWTSEHGQPHPGCDCEAIFVLSVGPGPEWQVGSRLNRFAKELCTSVVDGVTESHPADMVLWKDFQGVVTTDDFDMLVDQAMSEARTRDAEGAAGQLPADTAADTSTGTPADAALEALNAEERHQAARMRMQSLALQLSHRTGRKRRAPTIEAPHNPAADTLPQPGPEPTAEPTAAPANLPVVANDVPQLPAAQLAELQQIRAALYPPEDAPRPRAQLPLQQRLTVYAANTTLMLVALPVGAALLTYNVLSGEDAQTNARAVALTGAVLGLAHTEIGHVLLSVLT